MVRSGHRQLFIANAAAKPVSVIASSQLVDFFAASLSVSRLAASWREGAVFAEMCSPAAEGLETISSRRCRGRGR